mmetsp:Transcript_27338/g.53671  ORF Transcript_27338/g.53671 Transcript_27338/m.53671 type:complete len:159 (+) Transcript_27338:1392-1868(+)
MWPKAGPLTSFPRRNGAVSPARIPAAAIIPNRQCFSSASLHLEKVASSADVERPIGSHASKGALDPALPSRETPSAELVDRPTVWAGGESWKALEPVSPTVMQRAPTRSILAKLQTQTESGVYIPQSGGFVRVLMKLFGKVLAQRCGLTGTRLRLVRL